MGKKGAEDNPPIKHCRSLIRVESALTAKRAQETHTRWCGGVRGTGTARERGIETEQERGEGKARRERER